MKVFLKSNNVLIEIQNENAIKIVDSFDNELLIFSQIDEELKVESDYYSINIKKSGRSNIPLFFDNNNECIVKINYLKKNYQYMFKLNNVDIINSKTIDNIYKFSQQFDDYFEVEKEYDVNELIKNIVDKRIKLLVTQEPNVGFDDDTLLASITNVIPMAMDICSHPKQHLKVEEAILDVNIVKKINSRTLDYLSSHSEHWKSRTITELTPGRLRADIFEDEINIYENIFFKLAIKEINKYVHDQVLSLEEVIEQKNNTIDWEQYGKDFGDYRRIRIFQKLLPDFNINNEKEKSKNYTEILEKWKKIDKNLSTVQSSKFFKV